jgi:hypothetical protein
MFMKRSRMERTAVHELILAGGKPECVHFLVRGDRFNSVSLIDSADDDTSSRGVFEMQH